MIQNTAHFELPRTTPNGEARARVLDEHARFRPECSSFVEYTSRGHLLIVGPASRALACARRLQGALRCLVLAQGPMGTAQQPEPEGVTVVGGELSDLDGHLGRFTARVRARGQEFDLAPLFGPRVEHIDLVLDLGDPPAIRRDLLPFGYFAPADEQELERALAALPEMVGEFEKPKFFHYDPEICAHGRSGLEGCRRCIDACPALAIHSLGERIEVDPYLCQGGGSCATACPTGAITYAYPPVVDLLQAVGGGLRAYREAGGGDPQVLFLDGEAGLEAFAPLADRIPESVLPFQVEEIGSVGMDTWLAALAYGAARVVLFSTRAVPKSVLREISLQLSYAGAILEGLGYSRARLQLVLAGEEEGDGALDVLCAELPGGAQAAASFTPFGEKRTTLRLALDHLHAQAPAPQPSAPLPAGAPFGAIQVNPETCTLCLSCVAVCPSKALYDGGERPALRFVEGNCVQCGLCHAACPEDAIRLVPRIAYTPELYRDLRTLHEEEPFCCVSCGKPFATQAMMRRMGEKLAGHWMFQTEAARRRLQMCEDCRVHDLFSEEEGVDVYNKPPRDA